MSKIDELLGQFGEYGDDAVAAAREVVEHYEAELASVTSHLGQVYEEMMLLYDVGSEVAATLEIGAIAEHAVSQIGEVLEAGSGNVMLLDDAEEELRCVGPNLPSRELKPLLEWAARRSMHRDRSQILNDLTDSTAPTPGDVGSLLTAPLRTQGRAIGVVQVWDKNTDEGFSTEDQMLLESVATQIGSAIENSRLFHQVEQHATDLAAALDQLNETYDATLEALSGALDLRDNETEGHARRVTRYAVRMARELGVTGRELVDIERGALLHDIGKIGVPDAILLKPAKLTDEEWAVMRQHPVLGYHMIRNISFLSGAAPIVLHHHERHDGKGYPEQLEGEGIPLGARIFAVADTFDAMTSDRPYRKALPYDVAREEIENCGGSQFDQGVVDAFKAIPGDEWAAVREQVEAELASKRREGTPLREAREL